MTTQILDGPEQSSATDVRHGRQGIALLAGALIILENWQTGGTAIALATTLCAVLIILVWGIRDAKDLYRQWPLYLFPAWALLSIVWSEDRESTGRYSAQLLITCLAGVAMARSLSMRQMITVMFWSTLAFVLICVASGRLGAAADGMVLIGLTGSKNQMSFAGQTLMSVALAVVAGQDRNGYLRFTALIAAALGVAVVAVTRSATGVLTTGAAFTIFCFLIIYQTVPSRVRAFSLLVPFLALLAGTLVIYEGDNLDHIRSNILHKDATLTGRTYLWDVADHVIAQKPWIGHGYKAFLFSGNTFAIGFMRSLGATDPRAIGFQDTYREIVVDLGLLGLLLFAVAFIRGLVGIWGRELKAPSVSLAFFSTMMFVFAVRSVTDMSVAPIYVYTTLIFAFCTYSLNQKQTP